MFPLLILTFFCQSVLIFLIKEKFNEWRASFIKAVIILFTTVAVSTEVLSFFLILNREAVIILWLFLNLLLSFYIFLTKKDFLSSFYNKLKPRKIWFADLQLNTLWFFISAVYFTIFLIAIISPPNTFDVLTYHLPRVANWIQNGNVGFYPTHIERQLFNPPLGEYFFLHLQLLAGSDRFSNLVQFFCYINCGIISSLLAQRFKLDTFGQLFSAFLCASLPIAVLQASSSKNDLVVAFFITAFFYYFIKFYEKDNNSDLIFSGLSLGLALLTKGNAYFFCFPIIIIILSKSIFNRSFDKPIYYYSTKLFWILLLALVINAGHFYRNWQLYNFPIKGEERLQNDKISIPVVYSNIIRNYSIHLATPVESVNDFTLETVKKLLGDEINNSQSTVKNQRFEMNFSYHEDTINNPIYLIFLTIGIAFVLFSSKSREIPELRYLAFSIIFGFILFCLFLKWNYWVSRVHLPLFILGTSLISFFVARKLFNKIIFVLSIFILSLIITICLQIPRNLFSDDFGSVFSRSRIEQYFANQPELLTPYNNATEYLKNRNAKEIGLDFEIDYSRGMIPDWEYPYWILLKDRFETAPIIRHVNVLNSSKSLQKAQTIPEWILTNKKDNIIENEEFEEVWSEYPLRILHKPNF